jgi:hypothetical protein
LLPVPAKSDDVSFLSANAPWVAGIVNLDLTGSREERANRAAEHMNSSQRHMLAAGILLASIKAECGHGQFIELIEERGFAPRSAQRAMQYAQFIGSLPEADRLRFLELPRSKVMEIAAADPEVIAQIVDDGVEQIDALTVRALRDKITELEAAATDLTVQRDTAEAEAEGLRKKLKRGLPDRQDEVPHQVADARAEIVALGKKAGLALDAFTPLFDTLGGLREHAALHDWAEATQRLAAAQLAALAVQLNGVLRAYLSELPGEDATPTKLSYLTKQEVIEAARLCAELTQVHEYERLLREWERQQASPTKGKGRPKAKPVPPGEGAGS